MWLFCGKLTRMLTELLVSKKKPRIFSLKNDLLLPLPESQLLWPDRSYSPVFDVSLAGVLISSYRKVGKFRLGEAVDCKLRLFSDFEMKLRLLVSETSAGYIGLSIDPLSRESRILISEAEKEKFILSNLVQHSTEQLIPKLRASHWVHGPFDTNIFLWTSEGRLVKCLFEYDHIVWQFENGSQRFYKSQSYSLPPQGYESAYCDEKNNLLLGSNWSARAKRMLIQAVQLKPELQILAPYFQALQEH